MASKTPPLPIDSSKILIPSSLTMSLLASILTRFIRIIFTFYPYYFKDKRFDGSLAGSPKAAGTHDVIATLDLYTHFNSVHRNGEIYTNPVGFYLVLYDDGKVAKVPYDQIRFVPVGNREYQFAYPNEAGVPNTALGYDEYSQKIMGWKAGPRGGVGSPGQSYAHQ